MFTEGIIILIAFCMLIFLYIINDKLNMYLIMGAVEKEESKCNKKKESEVKCLMKHFV